MANIDFTYEYPYSGFDDVGRFTHYWSETTKTFNGCFTYPILFHQTVPKVQKMTVYIEISDVDGSKILGKSWDFYVWKGNNSWVEMMTFELPENGITTFECDMKGYDVKGFACVPSSRPSIYTTWGVFHDVEKIVLTENVEVKETETGKFQYGVFANRYGLKQQLNEVFVNYYGELVPVTDVLVRRNELESIPAVTHGHILTESECITLFEFTPEITSKYMIQLKNILGGYHLQLYDGSFNRIDKNNYFTKQSFDLTAGTLYYIAAFHQYYRMSEQCESYIQIYKEA